MQIIFEYVQDTHDIVIPIVYGLARFKNNPYTYNNAHKHKRIHKGWFTRQNVYYFSPFMSHVPVE